MQLKHSLFIGLMLFFSAACKKELDPNYVENPTDPKTCRFFPYRLGSSIDERISDSTNLIQVTRDSTTELGRFLVFQNKTKNRSEYYMYEGSDGIVYQFMAPDSILDFKFQPYALPLINPKLVTGSWLISTPDTTYQYRHHLQIGRAGFAAEINGKRYDNCIRIDRTDTFKVNKVITSITKSSQYWACGLGFYATAANGIETRSVTRFAY